MEHTHKCTPRTKAIHTLDEFNHFHLLSFPPFHTFALDSSLPPLLLLFFLLVVPVIRLSPCIYSVLWIYLNKFSLFSLCLAHRNVFVLWMFVFHRFTVYIQFCLGPAFFSIHRTFIRMYFFNHILVVGNKKFIRAFFRLHILSFLLKRVVHEGKETKTKM